MSREGRAPGEVREDGNEPFVGRRSELERLHGLLQKASDGSGAIVFISGDSGIGKTTLSREFLGQVRSLHPDYIVVRGRCVEQYGTVRGLSAVPRRPRNAAGGPGAGDHHQPAATYAPTWCLQLPAVAVSPDTQRVLRDQTMGATKERMLREMGDLFEAAATTAPLVGLLEDVQLADQSSVDLLRHLGNRIGRQRMFIVRTFRPDLNKLTGTLGLSDGRITFTYHVKLVRQGDQPQ
jgi:hypothetical protein